MPSRLPVDADVKLIELWQGIRADCEATMPGRRYLLTCTYRSPAEQFEAFKIGRVLSADGTWGLDQDDTTRVVTLFDGKLRKSKHNVRPSRALDFMVLIAGKVTWRMEEYQVVGRTAEARGLVWGGSWPKLRDGPHIELPD